MKGIERLALVLVLLKRKVSVGDNLIGTEYPVFHAVFKADLMNPKEG